MNRRSKRIYYSVLDPDEFQAVVESGQLLVPVRYPERMHWTQATSQSEVVLISSTIPAQLAFARINHKGIVASPYYGPERATLALYLDVMWAANAPVAELLFRLAPGKLNPLNDVDLYSTIVAHAEANAAPRTRGSGHPDDLLPFNLTGDIEFSVYDEGRDWDALVALATEHPFGLARGFFEFVVRDKGNTVGAIEISVNRGQSGHHLERIVFGDSYEKVHENSVSISRMYGPKNLDKRRIVHTHLLSGLSRIAPYLLCEPTTIIDCASYDYVPAFLDDGFRLESSGRVYDAFYYWKPVLMARADIPPAKSRRDMTAQYQVVKRSRDARKHYSISVNHRYWYLIEAKKMWALRKSVHNNGLWRSLRAGDIIFFTHGRRWLRGYGVVEESFRCSDAALADFPLGVRFGEVVSADDIDVSVEVATMLGREGLSRGIGELDMQFSSFALRAVRTARGGDRMWVVPNPFLITETDIEPTANEIFVVMPWEHRQSIFRVISDICQEHGYSATYAAETSGQVVLEDIWRLLNRARAVIVDFTSTKPNVFLEFGMAIVLGKPIIAITQDKDQCPSDVQNIKYIVYTADHARPILAQELPRALRDTIDQVERMAQKRSAAS